MNLSIASAARIRTWWGRASSRASSFARELRNWNPIYLAATKLRMREARAFDKKFGVDTEQPVFHDQLSIPEISKSDARFYVATPVRDFRRIIRKSGVMASRFTFVDLGCGKGRTLMLAEEVGFSKVIGVEADPRLCDIATTNARCWAGHRPSGMPIEVINQDARDYRFPSGNLFIYMSNPFEGEVLDVVVNQLAAAAADCSRDVVIAYSYNVAVGQFDRSGAFERTNMIPRLPWRRPTVSYHRPLRVRQRILK